MKHTTLNGKWLPENGTFVKVPNDQIPGAIQMLRENGQDVDTLSQETQLDGENALYFEEDWISVDCKHLDSADEIPFPDFKALVTGKLPKSWCVLCTEEARSDEVWENFCELPVYQLGFFYGYKGHVSGDLPYMHFSTRPISEVLQIETWAAVKEMYRPEDVSDEYSKDFASGKKFTMDDLKRKDEGLPVGAEVFPDETLIRVLKDRGYTISKIY